MYLSKGQSQKRLSFLEPFETLSFFPGEISTNNLNPLKLILPSGGFQVYYAAV